MDGVARRIDQGEPLRQAMKAQRLTFHRLAAATKRIAEEQDRGPGISMQLIAFLATESSYARETTTPRTAELIEDALSAGRGTLFEYTTREGG